jgi:hypothetical protein
MMVGIRHNKDLLINHDAWSLLFHLFSLLGLHASCDNSLRLMSGSCEIDAFFNLIHSKLIDVYIDSTRSKKFLSDF